MEPLCQLKQCDKYIFTQLATCPPKMSDYVLHDKMGTATSMDVHVLGLTPKKGASAASRKTKEQNILKKPLTKC